MKQNKKCKQTLESVQYGLEIIFNSLKYNFSLKENNTFNGHEKFDNFILFQNYWYSVIAISVSFNLILGLLRITLKATWKTTDYPSSKFDSVQVYYAC